MKNEGDYRFESCPDYNLKSQRVGGCDERRVAHIQLGGVMVTLNEVVAKTLRLTRFEIQVRILP